MAFHYERHGNFFRQHKVDALLQYLKEYKYVFLRASVSGKTFLKEQMKEHLDHLKLPYLEVVPLWGSVAFISNMGEVSLAYEFKRSANELIVVFLDDAWRSFKLV
jgi:hypothetical protein